jgi:hypothetical protein
MLEGSRTFDIIWGTVAGGLCFTLGLMTLAWLVKAHRTGTASLFGSALDPHRRLNFGWGLFAMFMGGTNVGCRYVEHDYLPGVHEGFFVLTLLLVVVLAPVLVRQTVATRRADARRVAA